MRSRLLLGALGVVAANALAVWWFQSTRPLPGCPVLFCDFGRHYLPTFRSGDPGGFFLYPPLVALLGSPFRWLSGNTVLFVWGAFQAAGIFALAYVPARYLLTGRWSWVYLGVLALSSPLVDHTVWGQIGVHLAALVLVSLALYSRGHIRWAAAALGLAIAVKYYPALFLAWWIARGDWRFVRLTALATAALSFVPVVVWGPARAFAFLQVTAQNVGVMSERSQTIVITQGWRAVSVRLADFTGLGWPFAFGLWAAGSAALLALCVWAFLRFVREGEPLRAFAVLFLSIPLFSSIVWPNYLIYLPFAQVLAMQGGGRWFAGAAAFGSSVLAVELVSPNVHVYLGVPLLANTLTLLTLTLPPLAHAHADQPTLDPTVSAGAAS